MERKHEIDQEIAEMVLLARKRYKNSHGKRITQGDLALMVGCSTAHINAIESCRHSCSIGLLRRIAEAVGKELVVKIQEKTK
jgi:DNA-binding XRE family transcriptional regulator